jgi:hypothetical protein
MTILQVDIEDVVSTMEAMSYFEAYGGYIDDAIIFHSHYRLLMSLIDAPLFIARAYTQ